YYDCWTKLLKSPETLPDPLAARSPHRPAPKIGISSKPSSSFSSRPVLKSKPLGCQRPGQQICWEAAQKFSHRFFSVNFRSRKHELGFTLMNQLSVAEKRFPKNQLDIAADYFALRKSYTGTKWVFSESRNTYNPASHCDIAWAGALATAAHMQRRSGIGATVLLANGVFLHSGGG